MVGGISTVLMDWGFFLMGGVEFSYSLIFDGHGLLFAGCVFFISRRVFLFSCGYMSRELQKIRFSYLVVLFVASILFLIFSGNLIGVLLGWDGLGLTSFLLVIYYQNPYSFGAGIITALTNRIGDVGLILSVRLLIDLGH
jgi:NADH-ubiquinone oxidoreductase chain 5